MRKIDELDVVGRFWLRVQIGLGCWEWLGRKQAGRGYGQMDMPGDRVVRAHRLSYQLNIGEIPAGAHICHTCDNPGCVRPEHLFLGDHAANMADKVRKGRAVAPRGEAHYAAKLSHQVAEQIRRDYATGLYSQRGLARQYRVSGAIVGDVLHGRRWA